MTIKYPLLTVENVNHWYWKCNPKWSQEDITKAVGCPIGTISTFMIRHNIPRRNRSEAAKNMHKCPPKRKSFIISHNSIKFKQKQSKLSKECWKDPIKRKNMLMGIKKRVNK